MRAIVQRCVSASVSVDGSIVSQIGRGLCVLVGIHREDTEKDVEFICRKLLNTRLFDNDDGTKRWHKSLVDLNYEILLVSQFTLYHIQKGNKPDFHLAMGPSDAPVVFDQLLDAIRKQYDTEKIKAGEFGAYMQVSLQNDGPVTLIFDSRNTKGGDMTAGDS